MPTQTTTSQQDIPSTKVSSNPTMTLSPSAPSAGSTTISAPAGMDQIPTLSGSVSERATDVKSHTNDNYRMEIQDPEKPKSKCQNICKKWTLPWRSLAPRTRKFLKTAGIAVVSAIVLVAIFHLARLAEQPDAENTQKQNALSHHGLPQKIDDGGLLPLDEGLLPQDDPLAGVYKDANGKVRPIKSKERLSVVQDMLAKTGVDAGLDPVLGVPVAKDVLKTGLRKKMQQQRLMKQFRPATKEDIDETLSLVQHNVDLDRKKLLSKNLRYWTPGDSPLKVLLVTTWRSGSTFLGQILQNHPGVFQHYEPLSHLGIRQVRSGKLAFQAQQLVHRLLDCDYKDVSDYLNYTKMHSRDMIGHNKKVWEACKEGPNRNVCSNDTFLSESCKMFPIQLVKSVRLRLNLTQLLLNEEKSNVKVVFLVRDPRATMSSRYSSVSWCSDKPDCSSPEVLCNDLQGDLKVAAAFKQLYPNRFTMIKYEDLAMNPEKEIKDLMQFLGMEYSTEIEKLIQENTQVDVDKPWSIKRKSSDRISVWKKQLPLQEIHTVQNACESVLKTLNYEVMGQ